MTLSRSPIFFALALPLATLLAAPAWSETCIIGPAAPEFPAAAEGDRLHALPHPNTSPHTGFHGQGLFGQDTPYLSHLAVFMGRPEAHPHNFQVILEASFADPEAAAALRADRAQHPETLYTVVPPRFDQVALVTRYAGREPLRALPGTTVFRGHFEQGGFPILEDVTLNVDRVVHFGEFNLGGAKLDTQYYLLFGRGDETLLAHLLSAPPDFDQILAVRFEPVDLPTESIRETVDALRAAGLYLQLPDRPNEVGIRLRANESLTCTLETGTRAVPVTVRITVAEEQYCEAGELSALVTTAFNRPAACAP
jgi:hypothetical protein